ncbi:MAG: hypothetical protein KatS3mg003_1167 [Candidatus Nitrosocaldaceae archaeon]|nr:MAG: hypothetical protein KatS3mg003_1167 [Candidatus Nitrosocaldaceae archaeon]
MEDNKKRGIRWKIKRFAILSIASILGIFGLGSNLAFAQTSSTNFDMTPIVSVIIAVIPAFIVIALLDKLLGRLK